MGCWWCVAGCSPRWARSCSARSRRRPTGSITSRRTGLRSRRASDGPTRSGCWPRAPWPATSIAALLVTVVRSSSTLMRTSCGTTPGRDSRHWKTKTASTFPPRRLAASRAMPPGSTCATARTAPCWTLAARPAPSRPPSAGHSQPGAIRAASPGAAAATATPTMCGTGPPAVRRGSTISSFCADVTTGPFTRRDSRSSCGMTATPASSGLTVGRSLRRAGTALGWSCAGTDHLSPGRRRHHDRRGHGDSRLVRRTPRPGLGH